jgi:two-component system heavy metal sensor histidine kinase CusS
MISAQDLSHRLSVVKMPQELSELAHGINFMLHRLDSDVQQLSQFSDDLAHELRAPISNLMGKAQVTLSRESRPKSTKRCWSPPPKSLGAWPGLSRTCFSWHKSVIPLRWSRLRPLRWRMKP